jgi:hypothetical protein
MGGARGLRKKPLNNSFFNKTAAVANLACGFEVGFSFDFMLKNCAVGRVRRDSRKILVNFCDSIE